VRYYFTPEQEAFRRELVEFFRREIPPGFHDRINCSAALEIEMSPDEFERGLAFDRKLIERAYYVMHWPREYGGQGRSAVDHAIFNELYAYHAPPSITDRGRNVAGPGILVFASEEQKRRFLPPIARLEAITCLGWTEPNAGSDLSNIETTARLDGDEYVINGQKLFISIAHYATQIFMTALTDTTVPKRQGASLFMVDMRSAGISISPLISMDGKRINVVYFSDVRVPAANLLGEKNRGFQHLATTANYERGAVALPASYKRVFDEFVAFIRNNKVGGRDLTRDPEVRQRLADVATDLEAWRMICWRVVWLQSQGQVPQAEASMVQLLRKKVIPKLHKLLWELGGPLGQLKEGSPWALMNGKLEYYSQHAFNIHGQGGIAQTKNAIAKRGLRLPRS
jgi:alkylation response protein AidB-like acyl-CoA dehydrogenase